MVRSCRSFESLVKASIELRRIFHQYPEMRWEEHETYGIVTKFLNTLGISWRKCAKTGIVAQIGEMMSGKSVGLRADMDGLLLTEEGRVPWISRHNGCMHACGHDGHMAVLLGVAEYLHARQDALQQPVTLIFQPAEEGGYGAREMIADGALEGVEKIFGWHNWPSIPFGQALCCSGSIMAANADLKIFLKGQGGHASEPEACRDPLPGAAAIILGLQQIVSRNLAPQKAAVISVTTIEANGAETIIPGRVDLGGSIRVENWETLVWLETRIREVVTNIGAGYGLESVVEVEKRYPAVINTPAEVEEASLQLSVNLGPGWRDNRLRAPVMASEDFSYYLEHIPGAFMLVGSGHRGADEPPLHSSRYDFNDGLIGPMIRVLVGLTGVIEE